MEEDIEIHKPQEQLSKRMKDKKDKEEILPGLLSALTLPPLVISTTEDVILQTPLW